MLKPIQITTEIVYSNIEFYVLKCIVSIVKHLLMLSCRRRTLLRRPTQLEDTSSHREFIDVQVELRHQTSTVDLGVTRRSTDQRKSTGLLDVVFREDRWTRIRRTWTSHVRIHSRQIRQEEYFAARRRKRTWINDSYFENEHPRYGIDSDARIYRRRCQLSDTVGRYTYVS